MPNVTVTPAQLAWVGGEIGTIPALVGLTAAALQWAGGTILAGPGNGTNLAAIDVSLDRLRRVDSLVDGNGPSPRFQLLWQRTMEAIETALTSLQTQVTDNATLLDQIRTAQLLAQSAKDEAAAVTAQISLADSYTDPIAVLSASSDGVVTIAAHQRVYANGTSVSVAGGSVSGFDPGDFVRVSYVDAARVGGSVTYEGTTSDVVQSGDRHVVGGVNVPQVGEGDATGAGTVPPGYLPPYKYMDIYI